MWDLAGVNPLCNSRKRYVVIARSMVAYALIRDGFTCTDIGNFLGKNHSTVLYYKSYVDNILTTPGYDDEKYLWEQFKQRIWKQD